MKLRELLNKTSLTIPTVEELKKNPQLEKYFIGLNYIVEHDQNFSNQRYLWVENKSDVLKIAECLITGGHLNQFQQTNAVIIGKARFIVDNNQVIVSDYSYKETNLSKIYRQILVYESIDQLIKSHQLADHMPPFAPFSDIISDYNLTNNEDKGLLAKYLIKNGREKAVNTYGQCGDESYYIKFEHYSTHIIGTGKACFKPHQNNTYMRNIVIAPGITSLSIENIPALERLSLTDTITEIGQLPEKINIVSRIPLNNPQLMSAIRKSNVRKLSMAD